MGGMGRKVEKSIFAISLSFGPPGLTDSPGTSYAAPRLLSHPLTVQNHSRPLHTHGSTSCKVDVGWDLSKKKGKMKILKKFETFRERNEIHPALTKKILCFDFEMEKSEKTKI